MMNQRGFATLEVILMVMVIGILASIAVPRFTDITTKANTAKIQADLAAIDTAISVYQLENDEQSSLTLENLKPYLKDATDIKPPTTGKCYMNDKDEPQPIPNGGYQITKPTGETELRATLGGKTISYFTKKTDKTEG